MTSLRLFITVIYSVLLIFLLSFCNNDDSKAEIKLELPERGICAHRGAMHTHPENTIPAFQEAILLGAHMIEFDVRLTKDEQLVILHDKSVDRTTNGSGNINNLTLEEVKQLDCGSWKSEKFKNLRIPTLEETLSIMPTNIWLNIHLKGGEELGRKTAEAIVNAKREHQSVVACSQEAAKGAKSVSQNIKICNMERQQDRENYIIKTIENKNEFIQILKSRKSENLKSEIELLRKNKIKVNYYGTDDKNEIKNLFENGVDFILVNELSAMLDAADSLGIGRVKH